MYRSLLAVMLVACAKGQPEVATLVTTPAEVAWPEPDERTGLSEVVVLEGGALLVWTSAEAELAGQASLPADAERVTFELPTEMRDPGDGEATWLGVVQVPWPWYATRGMVVSAFEDRIAEYAAVDGLPRKEFLLTDDRVLGGVYFWRDADAAAAWYTDAWRLDLEDRYGEPPRLDELAIVTP